MDKFWQIVKKNLIAIVLSAGAVVFTYAKDVFKEGTDAKNKKEFLSLLKSEEGVDFIYQVSDSAINVTMHNPSTWDFILDNSMFNTYVEGKESEMVASMDEKTLEIMTTLYHKMDSIAKDVGVRTDELIPLMTQVAKAYKKGDFSVRIVRGNF